MESGGTLHTSSYWNKNILYILVYNEKCYCVFNVDEVKPSKKYQGDKDAPTQPFRIVMAGASNTGS